MDGDTKGIGFADALVTAWKDAATKERQFTTPLTLSLSAKRPQPCGTRMRHTGLTERARARAATGYHSATTPRTAARG